MAPGSGREGRSSSGADHRFRAHARLIVRARAAVTQSQTRWREEVVVENLGLGGAGIVVESARLAAGDSVTVVFTTPASPVPIVLPARIAWIGAGSPGSLRRRAGLAFEHREPDAALALYHMMVAYDPTP